MAAFRRRYGAHPLHLLVLLASFALAGYAVVRLISFRPVAVVVWFVGAAVLHDLLLVPIYRLADHTQVGIWHQHPGRLPAAPWINYLRFPVTISGLLLLVFSPNIFRLSGIYRPTTDLSSSVYLGRWLAVTGALFVLSAVAFAFRLRRIGSRAKNDQPSIAPTKTT